MHTLKHMQTVLAWHTFIQHAWTLHLRILCMHTVYGVHTECTVAWLTAPCAAAHCTPEVSILLTGLPCPVLACRAGPEGTVPHADQPLRVPPAAAVRQRGHPSDTAGQGMGPGQRQAMGDVPGQEGTLSVGIQPLQHSADQAAYLPPLC